MKTIWFFTIWCCGAIRAFPVLGVGDVVIVASNPAQEIHWAANELPQWVSLIGKAEQQVARAREMTQIIGHPEQFVSQALEASVPALGLSREINALQSSAELVDFTRSSWQLFRQDAAQGGAALSVSAQVQVLGESVSRDRLRYVGMAAEKALRTRLNQTLQKQKISDEHELSLQERTLTLLRASTSQSEIALHQTALAASRQRMEISAARVKQAEAELRGYVNDDALEKRKNDEQNAEASEKFLERALARTESVASTSVAVPHL